MLFCHQLLQRTLVVRQLLLVVVCMSTVDWVFAPVHHPVLVTHATQVVSVSLTPLQIFWLLQWSCDCLHGSAATCGHVTCVNNHFHTFLCDVACCHDVCQSQVFSSPNTCWDGLLAWLMALWGLSSTCSCIM